MRQRLAWLDGLRAVAVLLVLYAHLSRYLFRGAREFSSEWLNAGTAGVMLFFLVSGYIIPASLERHGDLRRFWASRLRRLMPLYAVVSAAVVSLGIAGVVPLDPFLVDHPATAVAAHAGMVPFLLGVPLVTPVFWTLTFEMVFYLLVTALFALRIPRADAVLSVVLAAGGVATAPLIPQLVPGSSPVTAGVIVLLGAGLFAVTSRRRRAVVIGGLLLGGLAGTLLVVNMDPAHSWDGLLILAVMFTGTTVYRADHGQTGWWPVIVTGTVVAAALLANWFAELTSLHALTPRYMTRSVITLLVFAGSFALGMATRHLRTPRWLAHAGVISYSVYLVHYVLIQLLAPALPRNLPVPAQALAVVAYLTLLSGICELTYRFVELPGQRLGRRRAPAPADDRHGLAG
ncbi:acyltransferase family protein [Winogradskya humida]|uniref:Acyltransferase n=1 Tax=Winogradskya humida TaxID=113566 RepID=A0ABQ3ZJM8_9ACTN|nr:acyltransferase [Actinoplanes humidus]GIE18412.1 acyltransferase [Actinoplanes humidus]